MKQFAGEHTIASAIVGAQKAYDRKPADFYPTPPDATWALLKYLALPSGTRVWEPACGDGAMSKVMTAAGLEVDSSDLREDSGYGRGGVDFLLEKTGHTKEGYLYDWVITNPPFKVATDFILKALDITPNVAMLLKSQFWHARGRINMFEKCPPAVILPLTWRPAFLEAERGRSPLMDVMWCVWREGQYDALYKPVRRPPRAEVPVFVPDIPDDIADLLGLPTPARNIAYHDIADLL